jgi:hypothetical protein
LRVEVRAGDLGQARLVNHRKPTLLEEWVQWRQGRMKAEQIVEP